MVGMRPRPQTSIAPVDRLAGALATLPERARAALADVAARTDLPLTAGSWSEDGAGCLVANVVAAHGAAAGASSLDVRLLELFPELSSRDLNRLIVAWDEAAAEADAEADGDLRSLLANALAAVGTPVAH